MLRGVFDHVSIRVPIAECGAQFDRCHWGTVEPGVSKVAAYMNASLTEGDG